MLILSLQKKIFALLLSLPAYDDDKFQESLEERHNRLEMISIGIEQASKQSICHENSDQRFCWKKSQEELASLLISKGWSETKFSYHIHANKCHNDECDPIYATYINPITKQSIQYVRSFKARTNWQLHKWIHMTDNEWNLMSEGITQDSTNISALVAARVLSFTVNRCGSIKGGIALYATGKSCKWSGATNREYLYNSLLTKLSNNDYLVNILENNQLSVHS